MVRRKIEPDADRWAKGLDCLELKRADLDRENVKIAILERDFAKRFADIAAGNCALAARVQHLREQFCRRRFAVRPRDRDDRRVDTTPAQL